MDYIARHPDAQTNEAVTLEMSPRRMNSILLGRVSGTGRTTQMSYTSSMSKLGESFMGIKVLVAEIVDDLGS